MLPAAPTGRCAARTLFLGKGSPGDHCAADTPPSLPPYRYHGAVCHANANGVSSPPAAAFSFMPIIVCLRCGRFVDGDGGRTASVSGASVALRSFNGGTTFADLKFGSA